MVVKMTRLVTVFVLLFSGLILYSYAEYLQTEECQGRDGYYSLHHICKTRCQDDAACNGTEQCVCDGRCGLSCVHMGQTPSCLPPPSTPANGLSWLTPRQGSTTPGQFGTTVHFNCNADTRMIGYVETTCMSNGQWAVNPPYCVNSDNEANCSEPVALENASVEILNDQTKAQYQCHQGFLAIGHPNITCIPGTGWQTLQFECASMKCSSPGVPNNGFLTSLDFRYGSTITYQCHESYNLNGTPNRTCANGIWNNDTPTCNAQRCASPNPTTSSVSLSTASLLIGTIASYQCPTGYTLQGSDSATCLNGLTWSNPPPSCELVTCIRPNISTSGLIYSAASSQQTLFNYSETITYSCVGVRKRLHGDAMRHCDEDGQWTGKEPSCHALCSSLPDGITGGESFSLPSDALYNWHGGQKIYFCNAYFNMNGSSNFFCRDGEWSSDELPSCDEDHSSGSNSFSIRSLTHSIVDDILMVKQRENSVIIDCRVATFYGIPEWKKDSQNPPGVQYALRQINRGYRWYRLRLSDIAQSDAGLYECTTIDRVGSSSLQIQVITTCVDPGYQEGRSINRDTVGGVPAGRLGFIKFTCEEGYTMVGEYDQIGCDINGNWTHNPPDCVKPNCVNASSPDPDNGYSSTVMLTDSSAMQTIYCDIGYRMLYNNVQVPDHVLVCENGVWNGTTPSCLPRGNMIVLTTNGTMDRRDITAFAGESFQIKCTQSGPDPQPSWFKIIDGEMLDLNIENNGGDVLLNFDNLNTSTAGIYKCRGTDESYSEAVNLYVVARCPNPSEIPNGYIEQSTLQPAYYNSDIVRIDCDQGFLLHGISQLQCNSNGWTGTFPECVQDTSPSLYLEGKALAEDSLVQIGSGSSLLLDCADSVVEQSIAQMSQAGVIGWSKIAPNGQRISLAVYQRLIVEGDVHFLRLVLSDLNPDFIGRYACGTVAEIATVRIIVTVPCEVPPPFVNGNVTLSRGGNYQSVASYMCDELYELQGDPNRQCQATGDWSGEPPTCIIAYCPALILTSGASIDADLTNRPVRFGSTIRISCIDAMVQSGSREVICMDGGTWSHPQGIPVCTDPCIDFNCRLGWLCSLVGGGPACTRCVSESDCPTPNDDGSSSVCGNDAQDYPSECILGRTACQNGMLNLTKAFDGPCAHESLCFLRPVTMGEGSLQCRHSNKLFYYESDPKSVSCKVIDSDECLSHGGFESMTYCRGNCTRNYCYDPPGERGPCNVAQTYYTYDSVTKHCQSFTYGGCGGTQNRFPSLNDCIRSCYHQEVCPPCPDTMTLDNACFFGKHGMKLTVKKLEHFLSKSFLRITVDIQAVLTTNQDGINVEPGNNQRIYYDIHDATPCTCPRLLPLEDQAYLFITSTYRGEHLKADEHSFVAEWTAELETKMLGTSSCREWIVNL